MPGTRLVVMVASAACVMGLGSLVVTTGCGNDAPGPCPLEVPEDTSLCNSGGVVVYCHYDCNQGKGVDAYAVCSGPRWTVTRYDICARDGGDE